MTKKKSIIAVALVAILILASVLAYVKFAPKAKDNSAGITITVSILHGDGSKKTEELKTESPNLWGALEEAELARGEDGQFGVVITAVDGEEADESKEEWWKLTKGGEMLMTGAESTMIADGEAYELTFTVGYDDFS